ncbi:MAG: CDGSH iron-sulfur domain-containing protein [Thermoleophilia bacterium]|nr:CDGSH iron-sulfur domain-containing protein [Thermoleophilia bacterium]
MKIVVSVKGPYLVYGSIPLRRESIICDAGGTPVKWEKGRSFSAMERYSLCRCGKSGNMPFCDGTHTETGFDGTETASRKPYTDEADLIEGPGMCMSDLPKLCASAKFCHRFQDVWKVSATASDQESISQAILNTCDCPSGRLVAIDKVSREPIEPDLEPAISLVEIPSASMSGPLWVKGGIPIISADSWHYEVRNRVTLCRCGRSKNMPFCDSAHSYLGFNDGSESVNRGR